MSSNNSNQEEQHQSFWKRTFIGIPYWLLALVLLILILYWAYKQDMFSSFGLNPTPKSNVSFANKSILNPSTPISPAEARLGFPVTNE